MKKFLVTLAILAAASSAIPTIAGDDLSSNHYAQSPDAATIETGFSPDGSAESLILINGSQTSIRLAAYSFTSPVIVHALMTAKRRGVDVQIVVDDKGNRSKKSVAALNLVVNAGIPTRMISTYAIHHDKYMVSDSKTVETGSFNYSQAAAKSNSENVVVVWNDPVVAASFMKHWENRWEQSVDFKSTY